MVRFIRATIVDSAQKQLLTLLGEMSLFNVRKIYEPGVRYMSLDDPTCQVDPGLTMIENHVVRRRHGRIALP